MIHYYFSKKKSDQNLGVERVGQIFRTGTGTRIVLKKNILPYFWLPSLTMYI
jgi:hypothetical protein